ncbi:MAG: ACP S-malonyltransferase [Sedimentisphaerales bacterium]|nr:ACP S-malonyltransferase [Sedimentisphaerales bacterium]
MKTAFLFPGQGAQLVGMGADLARAFPAAGEVFRNANDILGFDLSKLCFEGPAEELNTTTISQPAIFATSAAILEVLRVAPATKDLQPDVTAGLSLGEYTALYAAGLLTFEDALRLVYRRGQAMQAAADATDGAMLSVMGLDDERIARLCAEARQGELLEAVNFNCPGQVVLSGTKAACQRAQQLAPKYDAIKAIPLAVAGAFHTEMMATAAESLRHALAGIQIAKPDGVKTIANISAEYYDSTQAIADGLALQLTSPILWQKCMERLLADGVEEFYEIGPGRVLTGLMRRINRRTRITNLSTAEALKNLLQAPRIEIREAQYGAPGVKIMEDLEWQRKDSQ